MMSGRVGRSKAHIPKPGEHIPDLYTVKKHISGGGFADIYIVQEKGRKEPLILKIPQAKFQTNEKWSRLFVHEAELWINLGVSQNIVTAYDVRVIDRNIHLFIEYIDGCTLGDRITSNGMPYRELVRIAMDVANGLSYAWRRNGIVHGDIRPENILISKDEDIKVTDFGLAYSYHNLMDIAISEMKGETVPDFCFSSKLRNPCFMSPEQLLNITLVDTRSDIYSFGVLLYKMATGHFPFIGLLLNDFEGIRTWHQSGNVIPPTRLRHDLSQELSELILKCLNKDPKRRFQDFEEIWAELKQISDAYEFTSAYDKYKDEVRQSIDEMIDRLGAILTPRLEEEGLALQEMGKHVEAIQKFNKAIENNPFEFSTWWNKGNSHFLLGETSKALDSFKQAKKSKPENIAVSLRIGRCLQLLERDDEALSDLSYFIKRASKKDDELAEAYTWRGEIYCVQDCYEEADKDFRKAIELLKLKNQIGPSTQVTSLNDLEKLFERFNIAMQSEIPKVLAWFDLNRGLFSFFQHINAELDRSPKDPELFLMKGIAYDKLTKPDKAEKCFCDALGLKPHDPEITVRLAELLIDSERDAEANKLLDNILSLHPKCAPALVNKTRLLAKIGDKVAARACLEQALEVDSENSGALNNLGILLMDEDPISAANYFKHAVDLDPDSTTAIHNLIILAKRKEDLEKVLNLCDHCLERDPYDSHALLDKALVHGMRGEIELAIEFATQAYNLSPEDENVAEAYKALREFPSKVQKIYKRITCGDRSRSSD